MVCLQCTIIYIKNQLQKLPMLENRLFIFLRLPFLFFAGLTLKYKKMCTIVFTYNFEFLHLNATINARMI